MTRIIFINKVFNYLTVIVFLIYLVFFLVSLYLFFTVEKGNNDCMKTYVKHLLYDGYSKGYFYESHYGNYHIDINEINGYGTLLKEVPYCYFELHNMPTSLYNQKLNIISSFNTVYCITTLSLIKLGYE